MNRFLSTLVLLLALPACGAFRTPADDFRVTVIVDTTSDPVSREQAEAVLATASESLFESTGFRFVLHDFLEEGSGGSIESLVKNYMDRERTLPHGILIFSVGDDDRAKINRGYGQQIRGPNGFKNAFVSPVLGDNYLYVAILQFNHLFAACGYAGTDTIQSQVSSHGECRGVDGQACVMWSDMQVCEIALPFLEGRTRIDMVAEPIVHEFMHGFGGRGPEDHYGSESCNEAMGWEPGHNDPEEAEDNFFFCPDVFEAFSNSYQP